MPDINQELGYCDLSGNALEPEAAAIVVFGATGDLSRRKIFPALYNLERTGILPSETVVIGLGRRRLTCEQFVGQMREACAAYSHSKPLDEDAWARLGAPRLVSSRLLGRGGRLIGQLAARYAARRAGYAG